MKDIPANILSRGASLNEKKSGYGGMLLESGRPPALALPIVRFSEKSPSGTIIPSKPARFLLPEQDAVVFKRARSIADKSFPHPAAARPRAPGVILFGPGRTDGAPACFRMA